jgi:coenzyme F420 hydrogenase subunit beta
MAVDKPQWKELFAEVVTSGLCTGCAACVVACPHDVLEYEDNNGIYKPWHLDIDGGRDDCTHGVKGCTMCTRACPRFRNWEEEIDIHRFARGRTDSEVWGIGDVLLAKSIDPSIVENGQDGGFVSALLVYALEHDVIDAALVSGLDGDVGTWRSVPSVVRTRAEVLNTAKSRYTYSANLLAYPKAVDAGAERIALVGMGCMASATGAMQVRKAGKIARRLSLTIGLLCSKTFDDSIFEELFEAKYQIKRSDIVKMNIKGVFQLWTSDGRYFEVPLKEAHAYTREGCTKCPDFAAQHADISAGGIGAFGSWTLVIIRTDLGREIVRALSELELIETRAADDDPEAVALLHKLARTSRKRWPMGASPGPGRVATQSGSSNN